MTQSFKNLSESDTSTVVIQRYSSRTGKIVGLKIFSMQEYFTTITLFVKMKFNNDNNNNKNHSNNKIKFCNFL